VITLDHIVVLILVLWGTSTLLFTMVALIYISPTMDYRSFFALLSPAFVVGGVTDSHSDCGEVKSQCCFDLHFLYNQGC
jgi:hypothetical protein